MKKVVIPEEIIDIAVAIIKDEDAISISFLQRTFPYYIEYDLAEKITLELERRGIIDKPDKMRRRKVLVKNGK